MEFFQNVSHELRTPLTVLLAPLQDLLAGSADRPAAERQDLQAAVRAARAAAHHGGRVAGLLRRGGRHPGPGPAAHRPGGADRADLQHVPVRRRTRRPRLHGSRSPTPRVTVAVDRAMWSTIVTNLVSNAVKYTTAAASGSGSTGADDRGGADRRRHRPSGSPRSSSRWCSTGSTGPPPTTPNRAPVSGWRWSPTWCTPTTAGSPWTAPPAGAAPSPSPCHCRARPLPPIRTGRARAASNQPPAAATAAHGAGGRGRHRPARST